MILSHSAANFVSLLNDLRDGLPAGEFTIASGPDGFSLISVNALADPAPFMPGRFAGFTLEAGPTVQFDENGIPSIIIWSTGEFNQSPTTIAQWGLGGYARGDYTLAQKACDWLIEHQDIAGGFPLTFNHSVSGGYNLTAPWHSAITQGNAISLLARMAKVTGDPAYETAAIFALHLLDTPVAEGGVQGLLNGGVWFEETPDPHYPNHIFNGSVFALLGIHDLFVLTGNADAERLWVSGEASLRSNINAHIVWVPFHPQAPSNLPDPWSVYDLQVNGVPAVPNYLGEFYMRVHCELLEEMVVRTGHQTYIGTAASLRNALSQYIAAQPGA